MRTSHGTTPSILEGSGYAECLDRLSATGGVARPLATYRLQLNHTFRFEDARRLVPYLHALGITHCYVSPILKARAGSMHGYDITDHNRLNPEIGNDEEFRNFILELKSHGMGLVLDIVPNHVGVDENNPWWNDVLENGRASEFADYFDIDWRPLKAELRDKLLLPVLGDQYGAELEQERIHLAFDPEEARFWIAYYDKRLPIDPQTIPLIFIGKQEAGKTAGLQQNSELQPLLGEWSNLTPHSSTDPDLAQQRRERIPELRNQFLGWLRGAEPRKQFVAEAVARCNGRAGNSRSFDCLHRLLEAQVYRLAHWRVSAEEINYRRFFDINDLVGLRMENPKVFAATHQFIRKLLADGSVQGLRVDHPDGLLNPRQYFTRLQMLYCAAHCVGERPRAPLAENGIEAGFQEVFGQHNWMAGRPPLYIVVEKILETGEQLPSEWLVDGTVGYEFTNLVNGLFINPRSEKPFTTLYQRFTEESEDPDKIIYDSKKLILHTALPSEVNVLTHMLEEICSSDRRARDFTRNSLRDAIRELIACFPVYRTYIDERGEVSERDRATIAAASARAKRKNPSMPAAIFDFIRDILLLKDPAPGAGADARRQRLHFALKFQQLTGPVMAKGMEDTTCYVYNRFIASNEVGGSPKQWAVNVEEFHRENIYRAEHWPFSMLTTSTHDTKRSEDVRARLDVLSEMPKEWAAQVRRWRRANRVRKRALAESSVPDANEEYLLYQTLVGAVPFSLLHGLRRQTCAAEFIHRIQEYMNKAVHEAKRNLSWINSNPEYVQALQQFIAHILASNKSRQSHFWQDFVKFTAPVAYFGAINSLAQLLLKITSPGIPDLYQGNEIWDFSLVDPDNRRRVDFASREQLLKDLETRAGTGDFASICAETLRNYTDGRIKMWASIRALCFRREHPELFQAGSYLPIECSGEQREHLCAFARWHAQRDEMAIIAVPRLSYTLMKGETRPPLADVWNGTQLHLPRSAPSHFVNIFSGKVIQSGSNHTLLCREIFADFPVALLAAR